MEALASILLCLNLLRFPDSFSLRTLGLWFFFPKQEPFLFRQIIRISSNWFDFKLVLTEPCFWLLLVSLRNPSRGNDKGTLQDRSLFLFALPCLFIRHFFNCLPVLRWVHPLHFLQFALFWFVFFSLLSAWVRSGSIYWLIALVWTARDNLSFIRFYGDLRVEYTLPIKFLV